MSTPVDPNEIERIVGVERHPTRHYARAVSAEQMLYILHSQECKETTPDLRDCDYSVALNNGIDETEEWFDLVDRPVCVTLDEGWLIPQVAEP